MIEMISGAARELAIGDPRDIATQIGPVIDRIGRSADAIEKMGNEVARTSAGAGKTVNSIGADVKRFTAETLPELERMLGEIFNEDEVAIVGEELANPNVFTALPFNHIIFTGSPAVGKIVMRTAADNLTPVTLELGGKSPAVVTRNYPLIDAALRITHGSATNSGQICVSPDYALVPRELINDFIARGQYDTIQGIWTSGMDSMVVDAIKAANKPFVPIVGADLGAFVTQLLDPVGYPGLKGAAVTNTAAVGGAGVTVALQLLAGQKVATDPTASQPNTVLLTPVIVDNLTDAGKANLKAWQSVPGLNPTWPLGIQIKDFTTYTPDQAIACKGPGE